MTASGPGSPSSGGRPALSLQPVGGLQQVGVLDVRWRTVRVPGGELAVAGWGDADAAGDVVVGVHGLTGNALVWAGVAGLLDGAPPLLAPDLRGRGRSRGLPGPYGLRTHADDLVAVLDAVGRQRAVLVGHGAGARVAALLAERLPERVTGLVLVDPDALPPSGWEEGVRRAFPGREEHRQAWRDEAGLAGPWNGVVQAVVGHDAVDEGAAVARALSVDAIRADVADLASLPPPGAAPGAVVVLPGAGSGTTGVAGAEHWTLLLGLRGADAVSRAVLAVR